ncbi:MAG: D-alanyl-D-alanine carboxypeptidase family protein [Lachnospiraceae bacterium]|nr:D-alanyl-D-alanine carboxypeptidase family protein [Lachnospiraceae bacterium]
MGRYNKGIGKQIKVVGIVGGIILGIGATATQTYVLADEAQNLLVATSVTANTVAEDETTPEVAYYDKKGYGWKKERRTWQYILKNGEFATKWYQDVDGKWYFFDDEGMMLKGNIEWKGQKYYLNPDGSMYEGWRKAEDGGVYYFRPGNGDMFVGQQVIDGVAYDFGKDGKAVGLTDVPNTTVNTAPVTPEVPVVSETPTVPEETTTTTTPTETPVIPGESTTTTPETSTVPESSTTTTPEVTTPVEEELKPVYYEDAGYGWKKNADNTWSYINKSGQKAKFWLMDETNKWYFCGYDGVMQTGEIEWAGQKFLLDKNGRMYEGFLASEAGVRYYRPGNGDMIVGTHIIDGVVYCFDANGYAATGWQSFGDATYFIDPATGVAAKGVVMIDGIQYYFTSDGRFAGTAMIPWELRLVNYQNTMPEGYQVPLSSVNGFKVDSRMAQSLRNMIKAAKKDGVTLRITSAYRTLATQKRLYDNGLSKRLAAGMSYEDALAERNLYNAEPGKSEHNLGLAIDFIAGYTLDETFATSAQAKWLDEHAHEYGFILRYEADKVDITKIAYEPWHYRYVGVEAATVIKASGVALEEYFPNYSLGTTTATENTEAVENQ